MTINSLETFCSHLLGHTDSMNQCWSLSFSPNTHLKMFHTHVQRPAGQAAFSLLKLLNTAEAKTLNYGK